MLQRKNTEIFDQPHKMWAEGTHKEEPTKKMVVNHLLENGWDCKDVDIWNDTMMGFWRWSSKLIKPSSTDE